MPHSVSSEASIEDKELPDAPSPAGSPAMGESDAMDTSKAEDAPKKGPQVSLEELFDHDDEDDEFSSSMLATNGRDEPPSSSPPPIPSCVDSTLTQTVLTVPFRIIESAPQYSDPDIMLAFYQRLFPFKSLFQWLNHSMKPSNDTANREIAFTLANEAYLRYQSYPTAEALRKDVLRLNPSRFEIGPIYTTNPRDRKLLRKASTFRPIAKELVFDIDLTDYDEVRTCCDKANICLKCWRFVVMAIKVVDSALREDFGFEHILWVYSGRRGAHAWVSDKRAREMSDDRRKAVAGYLAVITGGAQSGKKVNVRRPLHPHLV
ncbi:MAG: hypothetical protein LQ340_004258 [Diploschistes diacapsis]|nr:MAG: hypothetical protein LQ340_004258 [Diploschistes diacapsis]